MRILVLTALGFLSFGQLVYGFEDRGRGSAMAEMQQLQREAQATQSERNQKNEDKKSCDISCHDESQKTCSCCEQEKSEKT